MLMTLKMFACEVKKTLVYLTVKLMLKIIEVGEAGASCHGDIFVYTWGCLFTQKS